MKTIITIMTFCLCASAFAQNNVLSTYKLRNTKWEWITRAPSNDDFVTGYSIKTYVYFQEHSFTVKNVDMCKNVMLFETVFEGINKKITTRQIYYLTSKEPKSFELQVSKRTNRFMSTPSAPSSAGKYLVSCPDKRIPSDLDVDNFVPPYFSCEEVISYCNDSIILFHNSTGNIGEHKHYIKLKRIK